MAKRNTGSIRQVRPGVHRITVDVTKTSAERYAFNAFEALTARMRQTATVVGSREDAERKLHTMQVAADTAKPTADWTLGQWLDFWLDTYVAELRGGTLKDYTLQVKNHIRPALGAVRLVDLQPLDIQRFQNRLAAGGLGASSVHKVRQVLNGALRQAVNNGLLDKSPVQGVKTPKREQKKTSAPTVERVQQLLADAVDHKYFPVLRLMAFTGLRVGEALGLEWEHVDLVGQMVHVEQTVVTNNGATALGPPKSTKGTRAIPLDDETAAVLTAHRARQDAAREQQGAGFRDQGLVFPNAHGGPQHTTRILKTVHQFAPELHTHQLRHFFATQLMEAGVALPRVSLLLGHSSVAVTAGFYLHPDEAGDREAIARHAARVGDFPAGNGTRLAREAAESLISATDSEDAN